MRKTTSTNERYIRLLAEEFKQCQIGDVVTYVQLSKALGGDVREPENRFLLSSAMTRANKDTGAIFRNVRTVGYERLENNEAPALGVRARHRMRRLANKAARTLTNTIAKSNDMEPRAVLNTYAEISVLKLGAKLMQDRYVPELEEGMKPPKTSDVVHSTLDALKVALRRTR